MMDLIEIIKSFKDSCMDEIKFRQNKAKFKRIEDINEKRNKLFAEFSTIKMKIASGISCVDMPVEEYIQLCKRCEEIQQEERYCRDYLESFCKLYVIGTKEYNEYAENLKKNNTSL